MNASVNREELGVGTGLLVLGMHRSGTSALAGILKRLDLNLGNDFIDTETDVNKKGFYENRDANYFNQNLLQSMGSGWFDVFELPSDWFERARQGGFNVQLHDLLKRNFSGSRIWAVKDPRLCRVLPLWQDVIEMMGLHVPMLLIIRHPVEVAGSLKVRNGFDEPMALLLWLRNVLDAEYYSRNGRRMIVTYSDLLDDWQGVLGRAFEQLGLAINLEDQTKRSRIEEFLDRGLRHHAVSGEETDDPFRPLAIEVYESLHSNPQPDLQSCRERFERLLKEHERWIKQVGEIQRRLEELLYRHIREKRDLNQELLTSKSNQERTAQELESVKTSKSWRWTRPLRSLGNLNRGIKH